MNPDLNSHSPLRSSSSRREFLKTSTTATLGGVLAANLVFPQRGFAANADTLKIGLIGCGGRGTGAASQALKADPNTVLTAVGDAFPEACQRAVRALTNDATLKERVQVTPETTFSGLNAYQKVIESGVDVVLLAAPPGFRPEHLKASVAANKHIFCEKPMATDAPGVRSVLESVASAKAKKLALVAGFCWRYDFARREFFKRVHDGQMGEIRAVYATYLTGPVKPMPPANTRPAGMTDVEWQLRNWYNFTWLSGDGLVEQACHSVDKIAWAMNGALPVKAVGNGGRQIPNNEGNIYDHIDVFYEYENGARAFMAQRQISGCHSDNSDYLMGGLGTGTIRGWDAPIIRAKEAWKYRGDKNDMYQTEHDELFASIRRGEPINDGVWMAHSTLMAIMGRTAAYTGQEITWEQIMNSQEKLVPDNLIWDMSFPITPLPMPGRTKFV
ncbi:MAG TPA: Gfo/Idh/MocA family oxidoreductase [Verrucomicrobiota bacterium]|nr:Gfo/Idh/MocA family oxidoreductase [Verrucomicrobiota bacterium]HRZ38348.1 Gfo/Idh/MocA family oxidoreductase [Candidatus Paceibacterota bacterium]HRZ54335.1 Gfo/Idh/MocA family oxidoreductase [Candidatus Paceibacterota bacterium]